MPGAAAQFRWVRLCRRLWVSIIAEPRIPPATLCLAHQGKSAAAMIDVISRLIRRPVGRSVAKVSSAFLTGWHEVRLLGMAPLIISPSAARDQKIINAFDPSEVRGSFRP